MTETDKDDELDPAMEAVRRKLVRLLLVSGSVMALGFVAVIVAVIYRVSEQSASAVPEPVAVNLDMSLDDVREATVAGDRLVLTIAGEAPRIEVRRLSDGALLQTFHLGGTPAE